ncbi:response regulator transcription factor [Microcoleus sp. LEGE 07076]|uniref:response regulator transcription factor n=1 Tax=Microcoleus sp. LEGE 07076 TaxID=915322 RepID=UPI001882A4DD|nr:response regulator transcription factor [Microcoleus sp. LEGE 07076]MBE9185445.1 response regulator transcription factor [Microcoleus sp. LEGE 07076]
MTTNTALKILVVDDDPPIRNLVHRFLNQKYQVDSAADGETALALFEEFKPMLVVLDWNLPDTTGYHLCQEMQRRTNVFVVMLSSRTDEADKIKVLSVGADDYICKPFGLQELAMRIEVVLRRMRCVTPSRIVFDRFAIDSARREATLNDKIIKLTALEFKILYFLASHSGQSWSRQQLIEKIWGWNCNSTEEEKVVSVHIGQIRKKMIEVDATGSQLIKTVRGYGYRFEPPSPAAMAISSAHRH